MLHVTVVKNSFERCGVKLDVRRYPLAIVAIEESLCLLKY
jgi:hypothetical protein